MTIFLDSDVILDFLWERSDYLLVKELFRFAELGVFKAVTSPLIMANLFYLIAKKTNQKEAKKIVTKLRQVISIVSVNEADVDWSLKSDLADFEDALQFSAAVRAKISLLVTRNIKDFPAGSLPVLTPSEALTVIQAMRLRS